MVPSDASPLENDGWGSRRGVSTHKVESRWKAKFTSLSIRNRAIVCTLRHSRTSAEHNKKDTHKASQTLRQRPYPSKSANRKNQTGGKKDTSTRYTKSPACKVMGPHTMKPVTPPRGQCTSFQSVHSQVHKRGYLSAPYDVSPAPHELTPPPERKRHQLSPPPRPKGSFRGCRAGAPRRVRPDNPPGLLRRGGSRGPLCWRGAKVGCGRRDKGEGVTVNQNSHRVG